VRGIRKIGPMQRRHFELLLFPLVYCALSAVQWSHRNFKTSLFRCARSMAPSLQQDVFLVPVGVMFTSTRGDPTVIVMSRTNVEF